MKKILKYFSYLSVLSLMVYLILFPRDCVQAGSLALRLCIETVIPSLFPFLVCSGLFISSGLAISLGRLFTPIMKPLFNINGRGATVFLLGIISGYPVGAKSAVDFYKSGLISKTECLRLLAFCNNSGPLFILGVIGVSLLGNEKMGHILYLSHFLSALLVGLLFRFYNYEESSHLQSSPTAFKVCRFSSIIGESVTEAVETVLKISGFVILFSVIAQALPSVPQRAYIHSFLEIVGGIRELSSLSTPYKLPLISFFLGLSGLSVLFQVLSIISPAGLSPLTYIGGKILQAVLSFYITKILLSVFSVSEAVFSPLGEISFQPSVFSRVIFVGFVIACGVKFIRKRTTNL